ncbi:ABC transporter substrate-binding protein [Candidatus Formimonas warabiya]|uniref:Leucine-binding protein domain-containing protein n=1 Tax=Formimonas warabiya TaxID=1761012 RepID=A0A3G1KZE7_FORW1|nr:ABC transporter substrate-binding protein [Candidatus Formimonas warabiya]ATW27761.1 hypothetical protein DCMF_26090 [Candidatus Formimonas warabiya]
MKNLGKPMVILTLLLAFALGGCSQQQNPGDAGSEESGQEEPSQTPGEVAFGFSAGFTGDMAPWAEAIHKGGLVAIDEINATGGILGKKVVVYTEDNKSVVEGSVQAATKLVNVNKVSVIIGPESDPIMALADFAVDNKVPIISSSAGTSALDEAGGKGRYLYRTNTGDSFIGICEAKVAKDALGFDKAVILHENTEGSTSAAEAFQQNFTRFGGTILDTVVLSSKQSTYSSELKKAFSTKPPFVYFSTGQVVANIALKEIYQKGETAKILGTTELQNDDLIKATKNASIGLLSIHVVEKEDSQGWTRFSELYQKKYQEKPMAGYYQSNTYDAVILAALAMEAAQDTSGAAVDNYLTQVSGPPGVKVYSFEEGVKELRAGNDIDYEGASGPVDFNEFGNVSAPAVAIMEVNDQLHWVDKEVLDSSNFPAK